MCVPCRCNSDVSVSAMPAIPTKRGAPGPGGNETGRLGLQFSQVCFTLGVSSSETAQMAMMKSPAVADMLNAKWRNDPTWHHLWIASYIIKGIQRDSKVSYVVKLRVRILRLDIFSKTPISNVLCELVQEQPCLQVQSGDVQGWPGI